MILNRKKLQICLNSLSKVMTRNKKAANLIYKNVQFYIKDNNLFLYAFDGIHFISSLYGEIESADTTFMVEYDTLYNLIYLSDVEEVGFEFKEKSIKIISGKSKYSLQFSIGQDFKFFLDEINNKQQMLVITNTVENILSVINFLNPVIANSVQERFKGIYFDGNFVSTDSSGFALYPFIEKSENVFFISKESFSLINSISKESAIDILTTGTHIIIKSEYNELILPLQVSEFPNYINVVNKVNKYEYNFSVNKQEFIKACSKVKLFSDESVISQGLFKINKNQISITANSSTKECEEVIPTININIPDFEKDTEILLDIRRFIDYISNMPSEIITLYFVDSNGKNQQILIKGGCKPFYIETSLVKRNLSVVK